MNTQRYTVNVRVGGIGSPRVAVSQGDIGRHLVFNLFDGAVAFAMTSGTTATIVGRKPSGLGFTETCTLDGGNSVSVRTTEAMTQEAGKIPAELRISDGTKVIGTANFVFYVEPSPHPDGTTDGTLETMDDIQTQIGDLSDLTTSDKSSLVGAINEAAQSGGSEVVIDATLTQSGQAADAKATGDEISGIKADLEKIDAKIEVYKKDWNNLSVKGIWAQRGFGNDGWISSSAGNASLRIHTVMSLIRGEHYYIEWDNELIPSFMAYDSEYNTIGWLTTTVDSFKVVSDDVTTLDFDNIFEDLPSVYYVALSCKKSDDSAITPDDYNMIRIYSNAERYYDGYTFRICDFSTGQYSFSNSNIITYNKKTYLTSPRIKVSAGDYITVDTISGLKYNVILLPDDLDTYNPYYDSSGSREFDFVYRFYADGYVVFNVTTSAGGNIKPITASGTVTMHRHATEKALDDKNLLAQSRHTDSGATLLTLLHYSDNHGVAKSLDAISDYYKENYKSIDDVVNTGDSVYYYYGYSVDDALASDYDTTASYAVGDYAVYNGTLYVCSTATSGDFDSTAWTSITNAVSMYSSRKEYLEHDVAPLSLAVVGNHDTALINYNTSTGRASGTNKWYALPKATAYSTFFAPFISDWGVTSPGEVMYWYKDYASAKIRMIAVDMQYWDNTEKAWLAETLAGAQTAGYEVIILSHSTLAPLTGDTTTPFTNLQAPDGTGNYVSTGDTGAFGQYVNGDICETLIPYRGIIICNLCGHAHRDRFGYTALDDTNEKQLLTIQIDQSGAARSVYNSARIAGTDSEYLFNVLTFDTTLKVLKIVRIGCDYDDYLRRKKTLCYNYDTQMFIVKG